MQQNRTRLILVVLLLAALGLFAASPLRNHVNTSGKVGVAVYVLPENAKVTIGSAEVSEGTIYLAPGTYKVTASSPGYGNYSNVYNVTTSTKNPVLNIILAPESSDAQDYYNSNKDLYAQREGLGSQQAHQQSALITSKNPLIQKLPYSNLIYTIGYRADPSDPSGESVIIVIDAPIGYRNAAVNQIKALGFDPTDYKISFENYVNPFSQ